ncbi:MAG: hypothetical protein R2783_06400 [Gelidibacter sp.]
MKQVFYFLVIVFSISNLMAQDPEQEESLDSLSFSDSPHRPFLLSIASAPILEGLTEPRTMVPNGGRVCYDKIISFETNGAGNLIKGCLFLDTENGFMAYIPPKPGMSPECVLKVEDKDFNLTVLGLQGNVYNYFNYIKNNTLQHGVTTGNSLDYLYVWQSNAEVTKLRHTNETKDFLGGKIKAHVYKPDGRTEKWYLFGKEYNEVVEFTPKKYLGNFGIGYQYSDSGLYIIMQVSGSNYDSEITDIKDQQACFDSAPFKNFEDELYTSGMESINQKRDKLRKKLDHIRADECSTLQIRNIQYEQEMLTHQEQNLIQSQQGNLQQNANTQQARMQLMYNYEETIQMMINETEYDICKQQQALQRSSPGNSSHQRMVDKMECMQRKLTERKDTQQKIQQLDIQYANNPGKKIVEQGKLIMKVLTNCD